MTEAAVRQAAEAVARHSYGKLVAFLAARTRDVSGAEDALSDAFAAALAAWPQGGVPANPEAWLLTAARRRLTDAARRRRTSAAASDHLRLLSDELAAAEKAGSMIPDRRLGLMFACAHPAIEPALRAPLILQTLLGFDAAAIASAFLVSPAAMGQRLVRAKAKIKLAGISLEIPGAADLAPRLDAVLTALYAAYAEGWSDPAGGDARRRNLSEEAVWLARLVASLLPDEPEALGLLALMLHADARRAARRDQGGDYVPLSGQDTALWNAAMIEEAEALLLRAAALASPGRYQLEAAVQSAHAVRRLGGPADWTAILKLYDALCALTGSPVAAINRAVALSNLEGPQAALQALDAAAADERLAQYQPYWAARADLLAQAGQGPAARSAYERAIGLERDEVIVRFLYGRMSALV